MKLISASLGSSGIDLLVRTVKAAGWIFLLTLAATVSYQVIQNMNEQRQWKQYARDNNCYVSSQDESGGRYDEHGGRLATDPAAKVWSCDNGMKFKRY